MAIARPREPMTKEEQFREVAQILAVALKRRHEDAKRMLRDSCPDRSDSNGVDASARASEGTVDNHWRDLNE